MPSTGLSHLLLEQPSERCTSILHMRKPSLKDANILKRRSEWKERSQSVG